jgi:hypothetical protein
VGLAHGGDRCRRFAPPLLQLLIDPQSFVPSFIHSWWSLPVVAVIKERKKERQKERMKEM